MPRSLKTALFFAALSALGALAIMPYLMALQPEVFAALPLPLPVVVLLQTVQGMVLFTVMAFLGLRAAGAVGLGAPHVEAWLERGEPLRLPWASLAGALGLGFALAIGVAGLDLLFALPVSEAVKPAAWQGALASLYGAVAEEVQLRLFLMSVMAWGLSKLAGTNAGEANAGEPNAGEPNPGEGARRWPMVAAILLAALLFGVGHLPTAFQLWEPSAVVVARTILLNAALGVPFGWLYWRRGLEHAMAAHLGADLCLHVVLAALG